MAELFAKTKARKDLYLKQLGELCKDFRKSKGYTQKQVANELGISPNVISVFERGKTDSAYILFWYIDRGVMLL